MYLVKMNDGDKIVEAANEVRTLDKNKIMKNSINNWFKKNTKEEEKIFKQGLLAFSIFIIAMIFLKVFRWGIFYWQ